MVAPLLAALMDFWRWLFTSPITLALIVFQAWMFIDAIRAREWGWAFFILVFPGLGSFWYFFTIYRGSASTTRGFELPGARDRTRIKELQAQIHHLDKAHHHSQLGDLYFQKGKLDSAEICYRAALERDPQDIDTRAHFAQCLLRGNKPKEARPMLEGVVSENPKHEYGYSLMALAETYMALGETDAAIATWQRVTENHDYARARVQLAQLHFAKGELDAARAGLEEVLADFPHTPAFQRKRERVWVGRARKLMRQIN
jgi:hypothetical protein